MPLVLLQSTEDVLVNPANIDPFLRGRASVHHFWSHEFRGGCCGGGGGAMSSGDTMVAGKGSGSVYGRKGLTDLLRALSRPRGTFVAWVRAGHEVRQEAKRAVVDLLDALAKPTPEHAGVDEADVLAGVVGGAATLGLYPSGEFVARINNRWDSGQGREGLDITCGRVAASGGGRGTKATGRTGDASSEEQDASTLIETGRTQHTPKEDAGGEKKTTSTLMTKTATSVVASPFPTDLSIPPLPARFTHRAPDTSPIKRTHAAVRNRRRASSTDTFAFPARGEHDGGRVGGGRGDIADNRKREGNQRRKVVWKESAAKDGLDKSQGVAETLAVTGARTQATDLPRGGNAEGLDEEPSTSSFPAEAVAYDTPSAPLGIASTIDGSRVKQEDPWIIVNPGPSLDLVMSDPLQRDARRWVRSNRGSSCGAALFENSPRSTAADAAATEINPPGAIPPLGDLLEAEASLEARLCGARRRAADRLKEDADATERCIAGIHVQQEARSKAYAEKDRAMIAELETRLAAARRARAPIDLQRAVDGADVNDAIVRAGLVPPLPRRAIGGLHDCVVVAGSDGGGRAEDTVELGAVSAARPMPPLDYSPMDTLPEELSRAGDAYSVIQEAARDEQKMLQIRRAAGGAGGVGNLEQFQRDQAAAASDDAARRLAAKIAHRGRSQSDLDRARTEAASRLQPLVRGIIGRSRAAVFRRERTAGEKRNVAAVVIQTAARGRLSRSRARLAREAAMAEIVLGGSTLTLQRVGRGMLGRHRAGALRRRRAATIVQRCFRGHLGRRCAARQRALLDEISKRHRAAVKIQSRWRCRQALEAYAGRRAQSLAAGEIQRVFRGVIGRRRAARRREWEQAGMGAERLKLGQRMIEDAKASPRGRDGTGGGGGGSYFVCFVVRTEHVV